MQQRDLYWLIAFTTGMGLALLCSYSMDRPVANAHDLPQTAQRAAQSSAGSLRGSKENEGSHNGAIVTSRVSKQPAIAQVTAEACALLKTQGRGALVVGQPLDSDLEAPRGSELVHQIVSVIAGILGSSSQPHLTQMSLAQAQQAARGFASLAFVQTRISRGLLQVTVTLYPTANTIWDRAKSVNPGTIALGFGSARIDAHVRTYLTPIKLISRKPQKIRITDPTILAIGCDDIDNDGALEFVIVSRSSISTARVVNGSFSTLKKVNWDTLTAIAPAPWREPLALLSIADGQLWIGCTDRARSVILNENLSMVDSFSAMPVATYDGVGCANSRLGSFSTHIAACSETLAHPSVRAPFAFDASAAALTVRADGTTASVWAVRNPYDGSVDIRDSTGARHVVYNIGAQIALADIDQDGTVEMVASKNVLDPVRDAVVVRSWMHDETIQKRMEIPINTGVQALAVCPPEGVDQSIIAAASSDSVWIL